MDRISRFRVARLSVFPPCEDGRPGRYAAIASVIKNGVPTTRILLDGTLPAMPSHPTTEQVLEAFDAALRQSMLPR